MSRGVKPGLESGCTCVPSRARLTRQHQRRSRGRPRQRSRALDGRRGRGRASPRREEARMPNDPLASVVAGDAGRFPISATVVPGRAKLDSVLRPQLAQLVGVGRADALPESSIAATRLAGLAEEAFQEAKMASISTSSVSAFRYASRGG